MVSEPSSPPSIPSPISSMSASPVSSQESVIDPYLIHHSDSPTAVLVSPVLSGDNHGTWIRAITMALRAKNKLGFVDGSISKPTSDKELSSWARCNDLVSSWILNSVSPDIRTSVLYADTVRDIWNDLHERFSQSNAPKIYQLKQAISGLKQEGSTVSVYFTQLKSLWDELNSIIPIPPCICGNGKATVERIHQDRAMEFLQGLHDRFAAIRSQILLMEPFPTTTRIYSLIRQEEKQQEINNSSVPTVECAALHTGNQVMRHSSHHSSSHKRQRPFCDHCNRHGHTKATCYKLHGYPPKSKDMAAGTWSNLGPTSVDSSRVVPAMSFTPEQYAKILNLLSSGPSEPSSVPTANLAGDRAGATYVKLANCHLKSDSKHEAANAFADAGHCYKKTSVKEAISCLGQAIDTFLDNGRISMAARYEKEIAELYEQEHNLEQACVHFQKAAELFQTEEVTTSANQCNLKVAQFSAQLEQYQVAIDIYEEIARRSLGNNLLKYGVKGHLLNAGLCELCKGDIVAITNALERYQELDPTFSGTREYKFLQDLAAAIDEEDVAKFTDVVKEFDSMTQLDSWKTTLLLRAKEALKAKEMEEDDLT